MTAWYVSASGCLTIVPMCSTGALLWLSWTESPPLQRRGKLVQHLLHLWYNSGVNYVGVMGSLGETVGILVGTPYKLFSTPVCSPPSPPLPSLLSLPPSHPSFLPPLSLLSLLSLLFLLPFPPTSLPPLPPLPPPLPSYLPLSSLSPLPPLLPWL